MKKHLEDLEALAYSLESPPDILCLTETWLSEKDDPKLFLVTGYQNLLSKVRDSKGGGIMIQIRNNCSFQKVLDCDIEESLFVNVDKKGYLFRLMIIYNKPRANKIEFTEILDKVMGNISSQKIPTVICGDFNINILKNNLLTQKYINSIHSNGFSITPSEPTRVTNSSATCIDHFIYQNLIADCEILDNQSFSDHYPVLLRWAIKNTGDESKIVRDTSFLRYPSIVEKYLFVLSHELEKTFSKLSNSGISSFTAFYEVFLSVTEHYAPFKQINPNKKNLTPKWFDNKLKNLRSERNRAHRKWKKDPSNLPLLYRFKEIRIRFEKNVKSAKRIYYKKMLDNCLGDS